MSISYSENNKRENIFEPLLNRQRLVYKGPVPSSILNLANDQLLMDINRLHKKLEILERLIDQSASMSRNDLNLATPDYYLNEDLLMTIYSQYVSYDESAQEYIVESSTPHYQESLKYNKPQLNSSIIVNLNNKLNSIEAKLRGEN